MTVGALTSAPSGEVIHGRCATDAEWRDRFASWPDDTAGQFAQVVLGPDDLLVLLPREPMNAQQAERLNRQLPDSLRGRILVADGMNVVVAKWQDVTAQPVSDTERNPEK